MCFGNKALDDFLELHQLSYVMRAHEAHAYGVSLSKRARCFTVFSTSKDHHQVTRPSFLVERPLPPRICRVYSSTCSCLPR